MKTNWNDHLQLIKSQGFDGIEASLVDLGIINLDNTKTTNSSEITIMKALKDNDMKLVIGIYSSYQDYEKWENKPLKDHISQIKRQMDLAAELNPSHINCHSGQDNFTLDQSIEYFEKIIEYQIEKHSQLSISHETHRSRILYSPWPTIELLKRFSGLMLTLDLSHWVVVCERLLDDEFDKEWMDLVVDRCLHVHARIGTPQSPQVIDPLFVNDDDYDGNRRYIEYFESVWKRCLDSMKKRTGKVSMCPEYGPVPYTPMAKDGTALSDVNEVVINYAKKIKSFQ